MLIKQLSKHKDVVETISEDTTLQEAIDLLEANGFRCVPILDKTGKIYRGNIYKMHIYRHQSRGGDMSLPVTHLLKNATKYIHVNSSFFKVFFMIKDLPYITVLDENNHFYGILTHASLIDMLQQSWSIEQGSYVITVAVPIGKGALAEVSKIINRTSAIMSVISLDVSRESGHTKVRRLVLTLEPNLSESQLETIRRNLDKKGYSIVSTENLQKDN